MDYRNPSFDWKPFRAKSDTAYASGRNIAHHSLMSGGIGEIQFALDLGRVYFDASPTGRALDVACGAGHMTKCLRDAGFDACGFDISEQGVARAKSAYPELDFFVGNGAAPQIEGRFGFILVREFHPFKVIEDFGYQVGIVQAYLNLLEPGGLLAIAHASPITASYEGEKRRYTGIDFQRLKREVGGCGPFFYFGFNHLRIRPTSKVRIAAVSSMTGIARAVLRSTWIRYFVVAKRERA